MGQQDRGQIKESQSKPSCTFILWVVMGKHHTALWDYQKQRWWRNSNLH